MRFRQNLWSLQFAAVPELAQILADSLENALSVAVLAPPRRKTAQVEAIYDHEPDRSALTAQLAVLAALHRSKMPPLDIKLVPKLDWLKKVAADFPPLRIARWTVHGAEHRSSVPNRRYALQIDATSAFGTGEHPTTKGCLMMLDYVLKKPSPARPREDGHPLPVRTGRGTSPAFSTDETKTVTKNGGFPRPALAGRGRGPIPFGMGRVRVLDLGCGSGILAMALAQAAPAKILAVDCDHDAVEVARGNVRINGLEEYVRVGTSLGYNSRLVREAAPFDLILGNIFAGPLSQMAKDMKRHLRPGGIAILSGLLTHQANRVLAAHRVQGIYLRKRLRIGEWAVLVLQRPARLG